MKNVQDDHDRKCPIVTNVKLPSFKSEVIYFGVGDVRLISKAYEKGLQKSSFSTTTVV